MLDLEQTVMLACGLGCNIYYYNGSNCLDIREKIANKMEAEIKRLSNNGQEIAPPEFVLMNLMSGIAQYADDSRYVITKTWQGAANIIRVHMEAYHLPTKDRFKFYRKRAKEIFEDSFENRCSSHEKAPFYEHKFDMDENGYVNQSTLHTGKHYFY